MAWETQGPIARRELERLGTTDRGVIMFRQMIEREQQKVAQGIDPMVVIRDPARNEIIELPVEANKDMNEDGFEILVGRNMVGCDWLAPEIVDTYKRGRRTTAAR